MSKSVQGRRIGRFTVAGEFFRGLNPGDGVNLFAGMVVLDVRHDWVNNLREYSAMHADFRPCDEGEILPEYDAIFTEGSALPTWQERPR